MSRIYVIDYTSQHKKVLYSIVYLPCLGGNLLALFTFIFLTSIMDFPETSKTNISHEGKMLLHKTWVNNQVQEHSIYRVERSRLEQSTLMQNRVQRSTVEPQKSPLKIVAQVLNHQSTHKTRGIFLLQVLLDKVYLVSNGKN